MIFGSGNTSTADDTSRIDIYNITSLQWTTAELSIPRKKLASTVAGDVAIFGGKKSIPLGLLVYNHDAFSQFQI